MDAAFDNAIHVRYQRHRPEQGLVYRTIESYWPKFVEEKRRVGKVLPLFILDEFQNFLACGILENGFVRTYCDQCRYSGVVAFSCKRRGFCPSCCARRMNDEAAHLVNHVLPEIPHRQWVLSFPYHLRFLMACSQKLTNVAFRIFMQSVNAYQGKKAKGFGLKNVQTGSVLFIQRFGSALNLNIHGHAIFADGVFYKVGAEYKFYRLPQPTLEDLILLTEQIQKKVLRKIEKLGLSETDQTVFDENALGELSAMSIAQKAGFGERSGQGLRHYGARKIEVDPDDEDSFSANVGGYSLNARVVIAGNQRKKLERLIRYMARGPIASARLTEIFPNKLLYEMKTAWKGGTTHVSFSPLDFIARLAALIPPPRMNMVRYHGCFAPNFKDRKKIVKRQPQTKVSTPGVPVLEKVRRGRLRWAEMLK